MTALCNVMLNPVKAASREAGYKRKAERVLVSSTCLLQFIQVMASYKKVTFQSSISSILHQKHTYMW